VANLSFPGAVTRKSCLGPLAELLGAGCSFPLLFLVSWFAWTRCFCVYGGLDSEGIERRAIVRCGRKLVGCIPGPCIPAFFPRQIRPPFNNLMSVKSHGSYNSICKLAWMVPVDSFAKFELLASWVLLEECLGCCSRQIALWVGGMRTVLRNRSVS
jgi:hypothetical protein